MSADFYGPQKPHRLQIPGIRQDHRLVVHWQNFDMRILQNLAVHGHERRIENTSSRDDDLVCRVAVEFPWKPGGLDTDAGLKLDEPDAGIQERLLKPVKHGAR